MTAQVTAESTNGTTGNVTWTASLPDQDLDFLAQGETLTATFNVTVADPYGGTATQQVVVTFDGANDNPIVTGATTGLIGGPNLVNNGGFEDGSANWTGVGFAGTSSSSPHTGADAGTLTVDTRHIPIPDSAYTQTISTVAGQGYLLSFWADAISFPAALQVDWNGASVGTFALSTASYQEYFVALTGNGSPEALSFVARSMPDLFGPQPVVQIDDVSLHAILASTPAAQTTSGTISFADPDVNDTHTVATPVADGTGYLGTFTVGPVTEAGGSGTVAYQFTVDGADIQYLAQGQVLQQFYDVTIDDNHAGSATQTVEVDIVGSNDAPVFTGGATSGTINEISLVTNSTATDSTSGFVTFTDPDLTDTHTASASYVAGSAVWSGGAESAIPAQTLTDLAATMTAQLTAESTNGATGSITWTANLPDKDLDFLAQGETLSATFNVTVDDGQGGTTTQQVVVTFDGANDNPVATGATSGSITEDLASTNLVTNGGFENLFNGWAEVNGGLAQVPFDGQFAAALLAFNGTASVTQTISTVAGQNYVLSLWADTDQISYPLEVDWNGAQVAMLAVSGSYQEFFLTLTGNGSPEALSLVAPSALGFQTSVQLDDISLQAFLGPTPAAQSASGTISFTDPDVNDTHSATFVPEGNGYLGTFSLDPAIEAGGSGTVGWEFTVDRSAIQFLAQGQVLKQFYDVTVDDNHGGSASVQTVEVDITGTNDAPVFTGGATSGTIHEATLVSGSSASDTTSGVSTFTDPDFTDTHTASATYVAGSAVWSGASQQNLAIPAQTLTDLASAMSAHVTADSANGATGNVTWTASVPDQDLDFLAQGETLSATFNVTVSDGNGGSATEQVVVTFDGADDKPVVTGATSGMISEDLGPNLVTNGGFENLFSGWSEVNGGLAAIPFDGTFSAALLAFNGTASVTQTIPTVAGQSYVLSFWADSSSAGYSLDVDWNGAQVANVSLTGNYQEYFVTLTGNGNPEALSLIAPAALGSQTSVQLDDVSLHAVLGTTPPTQSTSGTISFADPDVNDTHSATFVPEGNGYLGTFTTGPVTESDGSGTVAWQLTVNRADIQYLAQGQELQQFYDVTINDGQGGTVTQKVEVDITGTDDAPVIAAADESESALVLVGGGTDTASGAIHFTDVDLTDRPAGSASPASITYTDANGQNITQTLTQTEINAIEGAFSVSQGAGNTNNGEVDWNFSITDNQLAFLTHGQSVTLTETVTVDDHNGGTDTSTVTLTLSGPNHPPVITSPPETATVFAGQSLQPPTNLVVNGGFENGTGSWTYTNFLYPATTGEAAHSGSNAVLVATYPSTNLGTISQTITDQSGTNYQIELWAIPAGGSTGNSLAIQWDGTTVEAWSNVPSITGLNPSSSSQYVEYTANVVGTGSDLLGIVLGTGYYWYVDDVSVTQVVTPGTEHQAGAITFTDADTGDTHTVSYVADGQNYLGTFTAALATDSTGGTTGAVDWSFSVADSVLSSLGAQQTIVQTYTVSIDDLHGGVTQQNVTVDITNPDHVPVIVLGPTSAAVHSNGDASVTTTNLIQDGGFENSRNDGLGTFWSESNQSGDVFEDTDPGHSGNTALFLWTGTDAPNDVVKVSQSVSNTVAGAAYTLTFFVENDDFDPNNSINVLWNNQTVLTLDAIPVSGFNNYFEYVAEVIGTGTATTLEFDFRTTFSYAFDDVSLVGQVAAATEQTAGTIVFTDADVGDTHAVAITPLGTGYVGAFTATVATESSGGSPGIVNWNYSVSDASIAGLDLIQTYAVTINDGHGGTTTEDVTVNINDHAPVITSGTQAGSVTEDAHTPTETASGAVTFTDADTTDTHTIMVIPAANGYFGTLTAVETADSTGGTTGTVNWTYSVNDAAIQSLAAGQTVTQTYAVAVNDGHGGTASQNVTITLHGANDAPVLNTADTVALNGAGTTVNLVTTPGSRAAPRVGASPPSGNITTTSSVHHGSSGHSAETANTASGTISQPITTIEGELYTVTFWVEASAGGNGTFSASWNGTQYFSLTGSQIPTTFTQGHSRCSAPVARIRCPSRCVTPAPTPPSTSSSTTSRFRRLPRRSRP